MTITIRPAHLGDAVSIADFNCRLAMESEGKELNSPTVLKGVQNGLSLTTEVQYFVAEVDGNVIGQLLTTREWSDWRNGWVVWLQSVYVAELHRRQGVFRTLFQYVKQQCEQDTSVVGIRLYVESDNQAAIGTYAQLGFVDSGYKVHELMLARR